MLFRSLERGTSERVTCSASCGLDDKSVESFAASPQGWPGGEPLVALFADSGRIPLVSLRSPWTVNGRTWPQGSLLACEAKGLMAGQPRLTALFTPTASRSLQGFQLTGSRVLLSVLDHVAGRVEEVWRQGETWQRREVAAPFPGTVGIEALHDPLRREDTLAEAWLLSYTDFLTPDTLSLARTGSDSFERLKVRPALFDATGMRVEQRFATSKDGTKVPYFVVWPRGAQADGRNPTLLYGYGGFEVSLQPWYSAVFGQEIGRAHV